MRILIDITHPAHLHVFRHSIAKLESEGHELLLTGRDKDCLRDLGEQFGLKMHFFGDSTPGVMGRMRTLLSREWHLQQLVRSFRPEVLAAFAGAFVGLLGRVLRVPTVVFYDTEWDVFANLITYPFATRVVTPESYLEPVLAHNVRFPGYFELAYLHPKHFTPRPDVRTRLGLTPGEKYAIVRFVSWGAVHDIGKDSLSVEDKIRAVQQLAERGATFVSVEGPLPPELERYRFPLPASWMHDALAEASLFVSESPTMSGEAAVLGVPNVFIYPPIKIGTTSEQAQRWQIVHWYEPREFDEAMQTAARILEEDERERWRAIGRQIQGTSPNVTELICEQILSAPCKQAPDGLAVIRSAATMIGAAIGRG